MGQLADDLAELVQRLLHLPWPTNRAGHPAFSAKAGLPTEGSPISRVTDMHPSHTGFKAGFSYGTAFWAFGPDVLDFVRLQITQPPGAPDERLRDQATHLRVVLERLHEPTSRYDGDSAGFTSAWELTTPNIVLNWLAPREESRTSPGSIELTFHPSREPHRTPTAKVNTNTPGPDTLLL